MEVRLMGGAAVSLNGQWGHAVKEVHLVDRNTVRIGLTSVDKAKANLKVVPMSANPYFHLGPDTFQGDIHANGVKDSGELQLHVVKNWPYHWIDPRQEKVEVEVAH